MLQHIGALRVEPSGKKLLDVLGMISRQSTATSTALRWWHGGPSYCLLPSLPMTRLPFCPRLNCLSGDVLASQGQQKFTFLGLLVTLWCQLQPISRDTHVTLAMADLLSLPEEVLELIAAKTENPWWGASGTGEQLLGPARACTVYSSLGRL